jgi:uncharacterized LabA/DUF88 family protein
MEMLMNQKMEGQMTTTGVWFIDARLMYKAAKEAGRFIQYKRLRHLIEIEFNISLREVFYFESAAQTERDRKRHKYLEREVGFRIESYELGRKSTVCPRCSEVTETRLQKCVDIALAMSVMDYATKSSPITYNPIVLSSGDRDFEPVLKRVRNTYDKDIVLVAPKKSTAAQLVSLTTRQIWIEDHYSSVTDSWDPPIKAAMVSEVGKPKVNEGMQADFSPSDAIDIMKSVLNGLQRHEKSFSGGRVGVPWGFVLCNFGKGCAAQHRTEKLRCYLKENNGIWKGANKRCFDLATRIWKDAEILKDIDGYPYLVRPI